MQSKATTVDAYINKLPPDRQPAVARLRKLFNQRLPKGFEECMSYGMVGWVVPHKLYPAGYHCDPKLPVPFLSLASQKQHITVYHLGLYAEGDLLNWFQTEHAKASARNRSRE